MARTIWKYPLQLGTNQSIKMPAGAEILCVHEQSGVPCMWALVEPDNEMIDRNFSVHGTGHDVPPCDTAYHGTAFCGPFVWHVFED